MFTNNSEFFDGLSSLASGLAMTGKAVGKMAIEAGKNAAEKLGEVKEKMDDIIDEAIAQSLEDEDIIDDVLADVDPDLMEELDNFIVNLVKKSKKIAAWDAVKENYPLIADYLREEGTLESIVSDIEIDNDYAKIFASWKEGIAKEGRTKVIDVRKAQNEYIEALKKEGKTPVASNEPKPFSYKWKEKVTENVTATPTNGVDCTKPQNGGFVMENVKKVTTSSSSNPNNPQIFDDLNFCAFMDDFPYSNAFLKKTLGENFSSAPVEVMDFTIKGNTVEEYWIKLINGTLECDNKVCNSIASIILNPGFEASVVTKMVRFQYLNLEAFGFLNIHTPTKRELSGVFFIPHDNGDDTNSPNIEIHTMDFVNNQHKSFFVTGQMMDAVVKLLGY